ncbi:MAG TPA: DNRLRE domain-containing protein [Gaiellaceae bacterium]|nr:DNRLRE domain-containing protein [Gaiellaceae bacterium]
MRVLLVLLAATAFAAPAAASIDPVVLAPSDDVSLPFLCDWGYDWQERCYRDDLDRLELGGAGDKVWRSALRFSLEALPPGGTVVTAELWLRYDATCAAPRRRTVPCDGRGFTIEARPIFTRDWYARREVAFGPAVAWAELEPGADPGWLVWDVTDTVADWFGGGLENDGILLKLIDEQEDYAVGGPALPSSSFADQAARPRLVVWVMT